MISKRSLSQKTITICTLTTLLSCSLLSPVFVAPAQAQSALDRIQSLFTGKRAEGTAAGRSRGGATRAQCSQIDSKNLIALVPESSEGLTTQDRPTFWFYVPFSGNSQSPPAKFRLLDEQKKSVLKQPLEFSLPDKKGIVYFSLPASEKPLAIGKSYRWYFNITCVNKQGSQTNIAVNGWIRRVAADSKLEQQLKQTRPQEHYITYANNNIWYEVVSELAENRAVYKQEWSKFLSLFALADVADAPITELKLQQK